MWNVSGSRLFDEEVLEDGVASGMAAKDGIEGDAVSGVQPRLREQSRRNVRGLAVAGLERRNPMVYGRLDGAIEARQVGRVGNLAGIGDRVCASRDVSPKLGEPLTDARCED